MGDLSQHLVPSSAAREIGNGDLRVGVEVVKQLQGERCGNAQEGEGLGLLQQQARGSLGRHQVGGRKERGQYKHISEAHESLVPR